MVGGSQRLGISRSPLLPLLSDIDSRPFFIVTLAFGAEVPSFDCTLASPATTENHVGWYHHQQVRFNWPEVGHDDDLVSCVMLMWGQYCDPLLQSTIFKM